jgi:hypothetical protein
MAVGLDQTFCLGEMGGENKSEVMMRFEFQKTNGYFPAGWINGYNGTMGI